MREIAEAVGMSSEWVYHILTEELGRKKLKIDIGHKCTRVEISEQSLTSF